MNITLDKNEMAIIEQRAIDRAAQKAARHEKMTTNQFLSLHKCTSISYYNGLFTVEFARVSRHDDSLASHTPRALPLHLRLNRGGQNE